MLANSCGQTQIDVCERHNNMLANCWQEWRQVLFQANSLPTCCCVVHTNQFEFANTSWPTLVLRVKVALSVAQRRVPISPVPLPVRTCLCMITQED